MAIEGLPGDSDPQAVELYEFQAEDRDKLLQSEKGLNASEMGTGKTYTLAAVCEERSPNLPKLWIGPLTTLQKSARKIHQLYPDAPITFIDPKNRDASYDRFRKLRRGYFFMHWEALRLLTGIQDVYWAEIVADEVQKAQNRKAQQTIALKRIKGAHKQGASGTPITGPQSDKYWSCLNWLDKKKWSSYWNFYKRYVSYEMEYTRDGRQFRKYLGPINEDELLASIDLFYVRHLKKEQCCPHHPQGVMPWLPDKYYDFVEVDLTPPQRRAYEEMRKEMVSWVGAHEETPLVAPVVIAQLIRLQQFACAYASVDPQGQVRLAEPSSKVDAVMELIEEAGDKPIVVFSQFVEMLRLIMERCDKAGVSTAVYTGQNRNLGRADRELEKDAFTDGHKQVFLGSIAAGGVGVDGLQDVASTLVFTDRLWSPALNNQAEDRLWRDGQKNAVEIIDIMARGTVDQGRHQRLEQSWAWIKRLLGDL